MEKVIIKTGNHESIIHIGENWMNFIKYIPAENAVIITDHNLQRFYGEIYPGYPVLSVAPGEESKKLEVINDLAVRLLDMGVDRKGFIVGIGGGVVCDIAGFLASIYMRGIRFGFVSTSLLSQVDASVGGKNGVNVGRVKNILGNINQPDFVVCDPEMLKTLPDDEYLSGLAELIKTGIILDAGLIKTIEKDCDSVLKRDPRVLTELIARSVNLKASVVMEDEKEKGLRMILNFGHTFGHAIEAQTGLKHGFAVAAGMIIAADISVGLGILDPGERDRLSGLLNSFKLLMKYRITNDQLIDYIARDKKRSGETLNFVLLEKTGKAVVQKIGIERLLEHYMKISSGK